MSQEAQTPTEKLTPHEQEMVELVENRETLAKAQANPEEAPEYKEETHTTEGSGSNGDDDEVDYKAKYEELLKQQKEPPTQQEGLEIAEDPKESEGEPEEAEGVTKITPEAMGKYQQEFAEAGELSEDSYKELEAKGISKEVVDGYIQGQQAIQEARVNKVYSTVGGKDNYQAMVEWAKESWDDSQIAVFNANVNSGDIAQVMFSVEALKAQFEAAQGSPLPKRAIAGTSQGTPKGSKGYESKQEMYKAMRNPAYGKDPSYTKMVAERVALSNF